MKARTRRLPILLLVLASLVALGCASTPASRIEKEQELFDTYPPETQEKIRAGKVDIGFDQQMVRMALGKPDETSTEVVEGGETLLWGYTKSRPGISVGVGGGGGIGGGGGMGGGVGMGSGPRKDYIAIIEFRASKVTKARYFDN